MRWLTCALLLLLRASLAPADPPNILLVITDDQGFGDVGAHGNPVVRTPNLDAFAKESVWLKNFYVCPVCSPTRSSLLTGQYNYRTGVVDTYLGRSMMRPEVMTLAEFLAGAGHRTGLFGKWHLGDNHPMRPEDQGFQETLWSQGGGLAQPSDPPQVDPKSAYFNPVLKRNGQEVKTRGYCTDVFTDAALKFITAEKGKPFFAYVAFNCPHSPYQVPDAYAARYRKLNLTESGFPRASQPWATKKLNVEEIARAYGMVENLDANFGRLLRALEEKGRAENTVVIFLTDNGPGGARWNAGLRNRKGTVYEGGIRVPCYVRWPAKVRGGRAIDTPLAHIDVVPTLFDLCSLKRPTPPPFFDGRSFARHLIGQPSSWPERTLFFQWHRGDVPEKYRAFAARGPRYKLVQAVGVQVNGEWKPKYELFDVGSDPFEQKDLAAEKPEEVAQLMKEYEAWFADVAKHGFAPPRIVVGSEKENPVRLSRQDWRGPKAGWTPQSEGHWQIAVDRAGRYRVTLWALDRIETFEIRSDLCPGTGITGTGTGMNKAVTRDNWELRKGQGRIEAWVNDRTRRAAATHIELEYLGPIENK